MSSEVETPALDSARAERGDARRLALLTLATSFGTALIFRGRTHPDEVFQVLEPAHRLVFGYGFEAWEWKEGLRNWVVVDIVAAVLRVLSALHLSDPRVWVAVIWFLCSLWQAAGAMALYRLVEEHDGPGPARLATFMLATWGGYLIYAGRPLGDALAIPSLLISLLAVQRSRGWKDGLIAGTMLGVAVVTRYPSLVFAAPLGLGTLRPRRLGPPLAFLLGLALVMAALGFLDWVTWGEPFHSLVKYVAYNQPHGQVVLSFGEGPWWWYLPMFGALAPYFLAWQFARGLRTHLLVGGTFLVYLLIVGAHPHKEERFLLPLVPLGLAIAAAPLYDDLKRLAARSRRWVGAVVVAYVSWSVVSATVIRPFDLGNDEIDAETAIASDPDLKGMLLMGEWWSCGGFFYLHRHVPMLIGNGNDPRMAANRAADSTITHVIAVGQESHRTAWQDLGWRLIWSRGDVDVWKDGRIASPPAAKGS